MAVHIFVPSALLCGASAVLPSLAAKTRKAHERSAWLCIFTCPLRSFVAPAPSSRFLCAGAPLGEQTIQRLGELLPISGPVGRWATRDHPGPTQFL